MQCKNLTKIKIIIKNQHKYIFKADKLAYAYVEHKEGKVSIKIYQPKNTNGYKWSSKHDSSVVSLWTKIPEYGDILCICSSLKDSLCTLENKSTFNDDVTPTALFAEKNCPSKEKIKPRIANAIITITILII